MAQASPRAPGKTDATATCDRLAQRLKKAQAQAMALGDAVYFRLHATLPSCDPWRLQARAAENSDAFFLWHDGAAKLSAAAWGALRWFDLPPDAAFAAAAAQHRALGAQIVDFVCDEAARAPKAAGRRAGRDSRPHAPVVFAAFPFDAARASESIWGRLGGGAVMLPKYLVYRRHLLAGAPARGIVTVKIRADGRDALDCLERQLRDSLQALSAAAGARPAPAAIAGRPGAGLGAVPAERAAALRPIDTAPGTEAAAETQAQWAVRVGKAQAAMAAGELRKVVLARQCVIPAPTGRSFDVPASIWALRAQHPGAMTYAIYGGAGPVFVGASPEMLVQVRGRQLRTQAVAGTAPRGASPADDRALGAQLLRSRKDRHEHALVADSLANDLAGACRVLRRPAAPKLLRLSRLQHLQTPFVATLRRAGDILALCDTLHPTPATGGWPRAAAQAWLGRHELFDRGLFAGPIGWLSAAGGGVFAVALRCMLLDAERAVAFAGAGIVPASQAAAEWCEVELKLTTAKDALRLVPPASAGAVVQRG